MNPFPFVITITAIIFGSIYLMVQAKYKYGASSKKDFKLIREEIEEIKSVINILIDENYALNQRIRELQDLAINATDRPKESSKTSETSSSAEAKEELEKFQQEVRDQKSNLT